MAVAETQKLVVQLDLKGNLSAKLGEAARAIQGFDRHTSNTQRSLGKFSQNIQRGVVVGIAATGTALLGVVKAAADYESAFAGVRKTVSATEPELKALSDAFRQMSKEIPISASELARLGEAGGALGVPTKQLKEFVRVTALLGVTTNLTADEAANSLGVLGNVLHLTGAEYSKFASSLVALGNAGASTESDIIAIAERAGAAGHLIGIATQDILGFASATASLGIEAEAGGTALQKFFIDSAKMIAKGGANLKEFATVAGVSSKAFQKAFRDDASGALQAFLRGLGKLPQAKQLQVLDNLGFNDARITRTLLGLANNTALVADQMNVANTAFAQNTALTKEAEQRFNTFDSQLAITKNTLTDMAITIGSKLLPKITPLLKRLNEFIGANQDKISDFGDKLATGFESFAKALQEVDWQPFIEGLRLSASIAKGAIDIFRSLPEGLQAALVGGFALNKVTGGLGTSIVKDIGGALLDNFAKRGSSPANPLFVVDISGGLAGKAGVGGAVAAVAGSAALPLVAIAASIAGPIVAQQKISSDEQIIAYNLVTTNVQEEIRSGIGDLDFALAGVNQGINDIQNNPLNMIVGGQALEELKANRAALLHQIGLQTDTRSETAATRRAVEAQYEQDKSADTRAEAARTSRLVATEKMSATLTAQRASDAEFFAALRSLIGAKGDSQVAKALKAALTEVFTKSRGSAGATASVLDALKAQLGHTHDPQLQASLRDAIGRVEHRLTARRLVEAQLHKADQIFKSNLTNAQKIVALQNVEKAIGNRSHVAIQKVQAKIDAAKRAQVAAAKATTQAIKDKDLSVIANTTVNVSTRTIAAATATSQRIYTTITRV